MRFHELKIAAFLLGISIFLSPECYASPDSKLNGVEVSYEMLPCDAEEACLDIQISFKASERSQTYIGFPSEWGGAEGITSSVTSLLASGKNGRSLPVEMDSGGNGWRFGHEPGEAVKIRYRLSPPRFEESESVRFHRGVIEASRMHLFAPTSLLIAEDWLRDGEASVDIVWDEEKWKGWVVLPRESGRSQVPLSAARGLALTAFQQGEISELTLEDDTTLVVIAESPSVSHMPDRLEDLKKILSYQKHLFQDFDYPDEINVSILTFGEGDSVKGNGVERGLVVAVGADHDLSDPSHFRWLAGHELLHLVMQPDIATVADEKQLYWYSEGFTNFINRSVLFNVGMMTAEQYVDNLNSVLASYDSSGAKALANERSVAQFWESDGARRVPYLRGEIAALLIDDLLQRSGERRVWGLAAAWQQKAGQENKPSVRDMLADFGLGKNPERIQQISDFIIKGGDAPLLAGMLAPCFDTYEVDSQRFDLGFDRERSERHGKVLGLRSDSKAGLAGLVEGMDLRSIDGAQSQDPSSYIRVNAEVDGSVKGFVYLPSITSDGKHLAFRVNDPALCEGVL